MTVQIININEIKRLKYEIHILRYYRHRSPYFFGL